MPNFLDLDPEYSSYETAKYCILPIPYERTTTYGKGTSKGPRAILEASAQVELFDEELKSEPFRAGIATLPQIEFPEELTGSECLDSIYVNANSPIQDGKFLIALGGEHTITHPLVKAYRERFHNLMVLHLDAHADLRNEYLGSSSNHACVMARVNELVRSVSVGIRSLSEEESRIMVEKNLPVFYARQINDSIDWIEQVIEILDGPVYLTIDVDYFDPSIIPSTGTPEPGGASWYQTLEFLRSVISRRKVVGMDIVELAPQKDRHAPDFMVAKLIYKLIGYCEMMR